MRVCTPSCGLAPGSNSGGEVVERELALAWQQAGLEQCILLARHQPAEVPVERLAVGRGIRPWNAPLFYVPAILACYRRHRFDVLRIHSLRYTGPSCLIASRILGVPTVATFHHADDHLPTRLELAILERADMIVVACEAAASYLKVIGFSGANIRVVPWGIADRYFNTHRPWFDRPTVLTCCGLKARKNVAGLLYAWRSVLAELPTAQLIVAGDGPEMDRLTDLAWGLGIRNSVMFLGCVAEHEKINLYQRADAYVILPDVEGFGMTILEAMAAGLPVVTTRTGVADWELRGDPITVLDALDDAPKAIIAALQGPRQDLAHQAVAYRFRWADTVKGLLKVYEEIAA